MDKLKHIGKMMSTPPEGDFKTHGGLKRVLRGRAELLQNGYVDWAMGVGQFIAHCLVFLHIKKTFGQYTFEK